MKKQFWLKQLGRFFTGGILLIIFGYLFVSPVEASMWTARNFQDGEYAGRWSTHDPKCKGKCYSFAAQRESGWALSSMIFDWIANIDTSCSIAGFCTAYNVGGQGTFGWVYGMIQAGAQVAGYYQWGTRDVQDPHGLGTIQVPAYYVIGAGTGAGGRRGPRPTPTPGPSPTPTPTTAVQARAVSLTEVPSTCTEITSSTNWRDATIFNLKKGAVLVVPKNQKQSGESYVTWNPAPGTYTLAPTADGSSSWRSCLTDSVGSHFGNFSAVVGAGESVKFDVAYGPPGPWFQTQGGGDVIAGNAIISQIPAVGPVPRVFMLDAPFSDPAHLFPGVVTYGGESTANYDFDLGPLYSPNLISSKDWLTYEDLPTHDFYNYFYAKLGSPETADTLTLPLAKPASRVKPYYLVGDVTTTGDWTIGNDESMVILVTGNLTIGGRITINGNGFLAFVVKGDISVSPSVGGPLTGGPVPVVEGVYLSSGTFHTGASSVAGAERFVGKGMFIANEISLERDLTSVGGNNTNAAEFFSYDPQLLFTMPDALKEMSTTWEEVAP